MTLYIHAAPPPDTRIEVSAAVPRTAFFGACFVLESLVFLMLPLSARFPMSSLLIFQGTVVALLFAAALACRVSARGRQFFPVLYALFVGGLAVLLSTHFSARLLDRLPFSVASPAWIAAAKLAESVWRVVPVFLLVRIVGDDLQSLYLRGGRLRLGLSVGMIGFLVCATAAFLPLLLHGGGAQLLSLSPWILVFVFSNGFTEELLFRGLFLRKYERFLGQPLSNLLAALVFTLLHLQVDYVADTAVFLLVLFPLALAWGWLIQKSGSLLGSVLFHAGADCLLVLGIYGRV